MKRSRAAASSSAPDVGPRGFQQKLAGIHTQASLPNPQASDLANLLVDKWSWGYISTPLLQAIALAAKTDFESVGATPPGDLVALSTIGSSGNHPQHMHRDLVHRRLASPPVVSGNGQDRHFRQEVPLPN